MGDAQSGKVPVLWCFSGPIGIVPHEPVHYKENEIGLREDENEPCPEGFKTMIAAFGSAKDRRNTPDDNFYMIEQHLKNIQTCQNFIFLQGRKMRLHLIITIRQNGCIGQDWNL